LHTRGAEESRNGGKHPSVRLALLRSGCVKSGPLLLDFGAAALGALHFAFVMFFDGLREGKFFSAAITKIFVLRHGDLPEIGRALEMIADTRRTKQTAVAKTDRGCRMQPELAITSLAN
jgi:hypothetical protein